MKTINKSAAHHFLSSLDKIKKNQSQWAGIHLALSKKLSHADIISKPEHIKGKLHKLHTGAEAVAANIADIADGMGFPKDNGITLYIFPDGDIILLLSAVTQTMQQNAKTLFKKLQTDWPDLPLDMAVLPRDLYNYQKMADEKLRAERQIAAYEALADTNRTQSIPLRRDRRDKNEKVILIVEDDRFSASYTANILNKQYDLVLAKTGEDAVISYIEHAPDMVLLDIHLPGWSGHKTLNTIKKADPKAYVIMVSVDTVKDNVVMASKYGAAGFIKKPFAKDRLLTVIQKCPYLKG